MASVRRARELAKEGEYPIAYPEIWYEEHPGAFPVDAVIVSNEKWGDIPRQRAAEDRQRMSQLFKALGFRVTVLLDKSADELKSDLRKISRRDTSIEPLFKKDITKCFVCFVSAYGDTERDGRQFILDHKGNKVFVMEDIIEPFKSCKVLDGKPKVFFINSIRKCDWHTLQPEAGEADKKLKPSKTSLSLNLLAVFSTEEEKPDEPRLCSETHFIPALIDLLHQHHNDKDVGDIVNEANRCQTVSVKSTLDHKLFWRTHRLEDVPGIVLPPDQVGERLLLDYKTPHQIELDIVLFHGYEFGGRGRYPVALSTWFSRPAKPVCWPVEWLPSALDGIPMRVFCMKYSDSIDNPEPCSSKRTLEELAEQVRKDLSLLATKPLIFIAHGLGGLLIQEVLNSKDDSVQRVKNSLRGIVFYGVPYDLSIEAKNFSLPALENALKQEDGCLSVVRTSDIEEASNFESARRNFCKEYKEITLSFEEGVETYGFKVNMVAAQQYATQVNTVAAQQYATQVNTYAESCSTCNHFDICRPKTRKEDTGTFSGLLGFLRKQLRNCDRRDIIVGQDVHFKKLKNWLLSRETKAASVAGITGGETFGVAGVGGIGKTTLAKSLLEDADIKAYYDHRVYWIAIKRKPNIIECQRSLLSEICEEMPSVELNSEKLLQELKRKCSKLRRVLLFLDDVWEKDHVDRLLGDSFINIFPPGSKCIITSRKSVELAKLDTVEQIEKLDVLNDEDARTLFCSKAFLSGKMPTNNDLRVVVEQVIAACGNMPIVLATIGANLWSTREIKPWEEVRDRLKSITVASTSEDDIYQNLIKQVRISYDDLPVRDSISGEGIDFKDYFLDFAAFPYKEEIEIALVMDMWTKPAVTEDGAYRILEELEQRSMVKIVGYWCYVHDIIRALAVGLIEEQPLKKRKKLFAWGLENGLPEAWKFSSSDNSPVNFDAEKMVIAKSDLTQFLPKDAIIFKSLTQLRTLILTSNLNLVTLPSAIGYMRSLAKLDLSWCLGLKQLPQEIGQLESLEKLNMAGCCSLAALPPSIGNLNSLIDLNMQSCGIRNLPDEIGELTSLTYLCLNDCNQLQELPDAMGMLSSLEKLDCDALSISRIPKALGNLSRLKYLSFGACGRITEIPAEFVKLTNLECLWFVNCRNLRVLPAELDKLATAEGSLRVFNVYNTRLAWERLPPNLRALPVPFNGTIQDDEVDSTAENPDGPYWSHRRGMLVNTTSLYDPSNKEQRRLSFGIVRVVTLAKNEPFMSPRFIMAVRIMYTMSNYLQTRHAIVRAGGVPVLLRCIDQGGDEYWYCVACAAATLSNMCVTPSTHKAIVDAPQGLDILTRALHRKDHVADSVFQALLWIQEGDKLENDWTYYSEIVEKCGHTFGHPGCACIWCQHWFHWTQRIPFLKVKDVF